MEPRHVLLASNRTERLAPLVVALQEHGISATAAAPGPTALESLHQVCPALVVVDADHVNGCRTVMYASQISPPPTIVTLADDSEAPQVDGCLLAGAADLLTWDAPHALAAAIAERIAGVPTDRRSAVAARRRGALGRLAAAG